jgi:hypothetical protein
VDECKPLLIGEFQFPVSEMDSAAFQTLNPDFNALKTVMEEVEAGAYTLPLFSST